MAKDQPAHPVDERALLDVGQIGAHLGHAAEALVALQKEQVIPPQVQR